MRLFTLIRDAMVSKRIDDQALYAEALREIERGVRRDGLWASALAASRGDERKAKSAYIDLLVTAMRDERYVTRRISEEAARDIEQRSRERARSVEDRQYEIERKLYEAQGARAKRIGWLFVIPAWIVGAIAFLVQGLELFPALLLSAFVAPIFGLVAYLVVSMVTRGIRL